MKPCKEVRFSVPSCHCEGSIVQCFIGHLRTDHTFIVYLILLGKKQKQNRTKQKKQVYTMLDFVCNKQNDLIL